VPAQARKDDTKGNVVLVPAPARKYDMAAVAKANFDCIMMMNDSDAKHYIPTISSANLEAIQLAKNLPSTINEEMARSLESILCDAFLGDSGATSTCLYGISGKTGPGILDGELRPTQVTFGTASKTARMRPLGIGDITVCLPLDDGRLYVKCLREVFLFKPTDLRTNLLSPAGLHDSRSHEDDVSLMSTGTPALSGLHLKHGPTGESGLVKCIYSKRAYSFPVWPIEALTKYVSPSGIEDVRGIIGDREHAWEVLRAKGMLPNPNAPNPYRLVAGAAASACAAGTFDTIDTKDEQGEAVSQPTRATATPARPLVRSYDDLNRANRLENSQTLTDATVIHDSSDGPNDKTHTELPTTVWKAFTAREYENAVARDELARFETICTYTQRQSPEREKARYDRRRARMRTKIAAMPTRAAVEVSTAKPQVITTPASAPATTTTTLKQNVFIPTYTGNQKCKEGHRLKVQRSRSRRRVGTLSCDGCGTNIASDQVSFRCGTGCDFDICDACYEPSTPAVSPAETKEGDRPATRTGIQANGAAGGAISPPTVSAPPAVASIPVSDVVGAARKRPYHVSPHHKHVILGHPGDRACNKTQLKGLSSSGPTITEEGEPGQCGDRRGRVPCETCVLGKGTCKGRRRDPAESASTVVGARVFMDVAGPFPMSHLNKHRWAVNCVDEASGYLVVLPSRRKTMQDAILCLRMMLFRLSHLGWRTSCVRSDNGPEFGSAFEEFAEHNGIKTEKSAYYSPHMNGVAERSWRSLMDKCRCFAHWANMLEMSKLWGELITHSATIHNVVFKQRINKSPHQMIHTTDPSAHADLWKEPPLGEGLLAWGCKVGLPKLPAQYQAAWKGQIKSVIAFYVGRSRINHSIPRFFVPGIRGGIFVETRWWNVIDDLQTRRALPPAELRNMAINDHPSSAKTSPTMEQALSDDNNQFFEDVPIEVDARSDTDSSDSSSSDGDYDEPDDDRDEAAEPTLPEIADKHRPRVGRKFARLFEQGWYEGRIVSRRVLRGRIEWKVTYNDGDWEEHNTEQITLLFSVWELASLADPQVPPFEDPDVLLLAEASRSGGEEKVSEKRPMASEADLQTILRVSEEAEQGQDIQQLVVVRPNAGDVLDALSMGDSIDSYTGTIDPAYYDGLVENDPCVEGMDVDEAQQMYKYTWINPEGEIVPYGTEGAVRLLEADNLVFGKMTMGEGTRPNAIAHCPDLCEGVPHDAHQAEAIDESGWSQIEERTTTYSRTGDPSGDQRWEESAVDESDLNQGHLIHITTKHGRVIIVDPDCPPIQVALAGDEREEWIAACVKELKTQISMRCWKIVTRGQIPAGTKILRSGWTLVRKRIRGKIAKYKARAYCAGFNMQEHIHYEDTSSPTPRAASFRGLVATSVEHGMVLRSGDITSAYLHASIDKEIYMDSFRHADKIMPEMFDGSRREFLHLQKALWGCKQSGLLFYQCLRKDLIERLQFTPSDGDRCMYMRATGPDGAVIPNYDINENREGVKVIMLLTYVDDLGAACTDDETWKGFVKEIQEQFQLRDDGVLTDFLGIEIDYPESGGVKLSHPSKIDRIVEACKIAKPDGKIPFKDRPLPAGTQYPPGEFDEIEYTDAENEVLSKFDVRAIVGMILHTYVQCRPDIGPAIGHLCRHVNKPRHLSDKVEESHIEGLKHIAKYLAATRNHGLHYVRGTEREVDIYVDADYAECRTTRKSISGWCVMMSGAAIAWGSKKQSFISMSSTEAELGALRDVAAEALALRKDMIILDPMLAGKRWRIWEDNQACIAIAQGKGSYEKRKHMAVRALWFQSLIGDVLDIFYINTHEQVADCLTKCLDSIKVAKFRSLLLNEGVHVHQNQRCPSARAYTRSLLAPAKVGPVAPVYSGVVPERRPVARAAHTYNLPSTTTTPGLT